jgi:CBS domain-containing protein
MVRCRDIMTKDLEYCVTTTPVDLVAGVMRAMKVGAVPIVDALNTRHLVGIITDRDLALRVVAEGRSPRTTLAEDVMTRRLVTAGPHADVEAALSLMEEYRIRRIPIVDSAGQLVGIISESDVATRLKNPEQTDRVVRAISRAKAIRE